jgi:hypothetical protein
MLKKKTQKIITGSIAAAIVLAIGGTFALSNLAGVKLGNSKDFTKDSETLQTSETVKSPYGDFQTETIGSADDSLLGNANLVNPGGDESTLNKDEVKEVQTFAANFFMQKVINSPYWNDSDSNNYKSDVSSYFSSNLDPTQENVIENSAIAQRVNAQVPNTISDGGKRWESFTALSPVIVNQTFDNQTSYMVSFSYYGSIRTTGSDMKNQLKKIFKTDDLSTVLEVPEDYLNDDEVTENLSGNYSLTLVKENNEWKISSVDSTVNTSIPYLTQEKQQELMDRSMPGGSESEPAAEQ